MQEPVDGVAGTFLQPTELSRTAFLQAMESSFLVLAVIIAAAALVIAAWAPGRDGRRLRLVRRITSCRHDRAAWHRF